MNWAWKISILLGSFVLFMSYLVYRTFNTDFDLVADDYYAKELIFQDQINSENAAASLDVPLIVVLEKGNIVFKFPDGAPDSGEILIYRPSDASLDLTLDIKTDSSGVQYYNYKDLQSGYYKFRVKWNKNDVSYFKEVKLKI